MTRARAAPLPCIPCSRDTYGATTPPFATEAIHANDTICGQANIVRRDPREETTVKMERVKSSDLKSTNKVTRSFLERSGVMKALLKVVGVLGVSLVMSGMLKCCEVWHQVLLTDMQMASSHLPSPFWVQFRGMF